MQDPWFKKNYSPVKLREDEKVNLDDVQAVFNDIEVCCYFLFFLKINKLYTQLVFENIRVYL